MSAIWIKRKEKIEPAKTPEKDLSNIKEKFEKVCTNAHKANGKYKNSDYIKWSQEALDRGELYFYTEPVDPKKPFGPKRLCEPKYEWRLNGALSEEEYAKLFG